MGDFLSGNPIVVVIAACEAGFWVLLVGSLLTRYLLRLTRLSTVLLCAIPLLDVVLVVASLLDVGRGREPGLAHGLAGVYLGFTVAFGHLTVRWADRRFAHRFAGGPPPARPPKYGPERVAHEWRLWGRAALGVAVAFAVLLAITFVGGRSVPSPLQWFADPLWTWGARAGVGLLIWLLGWPVWVTLSPPRPPQVRRTAGDPAARR